VSDSEGAAAKDLERRLATILSADVAEYSRLMAEDEEQTLRVFRGHKEVFERLVAVHRGRVFNTAGDAILAEFASAVEAVRCATEIQAALRTRNDQLPESRQVQFRIGVNLGDVMVQDHDLLGDGVNVAARLQSAASPGGICISGSVYDQIRNRLSLSFKPLGEMNFKNIPQAVRTFSIIEAEGLGELPSPPSGRSRGSGGSLKWVGVAAAILLLSLAGGGAYWLVSDQHRRDAEIARAARAAAEKVATEERRIRAESAERRKAAAAQPVAPAAETHPVVNDGIYAGPICYDAYQDQAARCFPVRVTLAQGRIAGQWPGRDAGVTMHLEGDVSVSGHVTIHLYGEKADGGHLAPIDFGGTLHDGSLDATGAFTNGRTATLNWRRSEGGSSSAVPAAATPAPAAPAAPAPTPAAATPAAGPTPAVTPTAAPVAPAAIVAADPPLAAPAAPTTPTAAGFEGLYVGPVCYGPSAADPARCFRAQATVENGRITGQWPGTAGATMHLEGDVTPSGEVTIHMHAEAADGSRRAVINLAGTLHGGHLDATGSFANGRRTASLNWHRR
jgi:class 3 adenylate cyclase